MQKQKCCTAAEAEVQHLLGSSLVSCSSMQHHIKTAAVISSQPTIMSPCYMPGWNPLTTWLLLQEMSLIPARAAMWEEQGSEPQESHFTHSILSAAGRIEDFSLSRSLKNSPVQGGGVWHRLFTNVKNVSWVPAIPSSSVGLRSSSVFPDAWLPPHPTVSTAFPVPVGRLSTPLVNTAGPSTQGPGLQP